MDDERISYEMLQDLVRAERRSNRLSPVRARFWHDLRDFLDDIRAGFAQEQEKDPFSRRAMMARDEAQHALQAAESLWSLRERKMALFALAQPKEGGAERPEGLTAQEIDLYDRFVRTLRDGRSEVFGGHPGAPVAAPAPPPAARPAPAEPAEAPAATEARPTPPTPAAPAEPAAEPVPPDLHAPPEEADEPEPAEPAPPATVPPDTPTDDLLTIRALGDIPPFVGPDMQTYLLREGDFAMVPPAIARLLEKRGKAEVMQTA